MSLGMVFLIIGSLALGVFTGFINSLISKRAMKKTETASAIGINAVRLLLDVVALAIVFAVCKISVQPFAAPLLAGAVGLTVGGMFFLVRLTRSFTNKREDQN